jgi:hypothetical protein
VRFCGIGRLCVTTLLERSTSLQKKGTMRIHHLVFISVISILTFLLVLLFIMLGCISPLDN